MFKIIALVLLSIIFLFQLFINIKSYLSRERPIPEEVKDIYDEETYTKWKAYSADKLKVDIIFSIINFIISFALIITDIFALITKSIDNVYLSTLVVLAIYIGLSAIIDIFIHGYITNIKIEGKYGFNKSTSGTFVGDSIRKIIIMAVLMIGLTMLFISLYESIGDYILILFSAILIVIVLFVNILFPLLSKASNRFVSLEEGELRTRLMDLLTKHGFQISDIKVMDASRRTTKSNAYFTGLGKTKTVVLYDNMLKTLSDDEIVAVFAHELAHGLHKDSLKSTPLSYLYIAITVVLAWLLVRFPEIYKDFGFSGVNYGFGVILLFDCVIGLVFRVLMIPRLILSRRAEYKADEFAAREGYGKELISGLKKLIRENLGHLNPDPLVVILCYAQPALAQRIRNSNQVTKESS